VFTLLLCLIFLLQLPNATANSQIHAQEFELKAIYCYNLLHFVHWPTKQTKSESRQLNIIILGSSPEFIASLDALSQQVKKGGNDEISITQVNSYSNNIDFNKFHLVYITTAQAKNLPAILAKVKNSPILTVGDTDGFIEAGGMINLLISEGPKVRWEVNQGALELSGLKLSAKVLQSAVRVVGAPALTKTTADGALR
jgi:hypothetical protein